MSLWSFRKQKTILLDSKTKKILQNSNSRIANLHRHWIWITIVMLTFFLTVWEIEEVVWSTSLLPQQPRKKSILFCSKYFLVTVSQLQMTFGTRLDGTADCRGKDTKGGCEFQFYRLEAWEVRNRWKQLCGRGISRSFATSILIGRLGCCPSV